MSLLLRDIYKSALPTDYANHFIAVERLEDDSFGRKKFFPSLNLWAILLLYFWFIKNKLYKPLVITAILHNMFGFILLMIIRPSPSPNLTNIPQENVLYGYSILILAVVINLVIGLYANSIYYFFKKGEIDDLISELELDVSVPPQNGSKRKERREFEKDRKKSLKSTQEKLEIIKEKISPYTWRRDWFKILGASIAFIISFVLVTELVKAVYFLLS